MIWYPFAKKLSSVRTALAIRSKKKCHSFNYSGYPFAQNCYPLERLADALSVRRKLSSKVFDWLELSLQNYCQLRYCYKPLSPEPFASDLSKNASLSKSYERCLPSPHEFSRYIFCLIALYTLITFDLYRYKFYPRLRHIQQISRTSYYVLNFQTLLVAVHGNMINKLCLFKYLLKAYCQRQRSEK